MEPGKCKEYIGDGAYADFDGYGITLTTENGISVTNEIYLEPEVIEALKRYFKRIQDLRERAESDAKL